MGGDSMNCNHCGNPLEDGAESCSFCGQPVTPEVTVLPVQTAVTVEPRKENVLTGIVGALLGAAIGGIVIILLSQIGLVASISGLLLAVCTLKGYELLGRKLSIKGVIICLVLIIITPYLADRLDWAMILRDSWDNEITLAEAFIIVPEVIAMDAEIKAEYIKCLVLLYVFAAMGAFGTIRDLFKK